MESHEDTIESYKPEIMVVNHDKEVVEKAIKEIESFQDEILKEGLL